MRTLSILSLGLLIVGLIACTAAPPPPVTAPRPTGTPAPTSTPVPTRTPAPTWTPTPIPTATPLPAVRLQVEWPSRVSPLRPLPVTARLITPPGLVASARVSAKVISPNAAVHATFELSERAGDRYTSPDVLTLPLEPIAGTWWLVVEVDLALPLVGSPVVAFEVEPVAFHDLEARLPGGTSLRVPAGFEEMVAQGDPIAGGRVWAYAEGEVGLWWAPGPTEKLLVNNALVMLEATQVVDDRYPPPPPPVEALPLMWQGRTAFEFSEVWSGAQGGPGRAWVIQGDDWRLYVLRIRGLGTPEVPALHRAVAGTFRVGADLD